MKDSKQNESITVTQKAIGSFKWSVLIELLPRILQPLIYLILARLLTPNDFGLVATAMIVINFSQMFWEAGLGKALVQTEHPPEKTADIVFWTDLALGIIIYTLLFIFAPWLANFFNNPTSLCVLRVLGIELVISSLASVPKALFVRDLSFRQLFWVRLATAFIPALFSIPMAFLGYGVWALIAGSLIASLLNLALLWMLSTYRPHLEFDWDVALKLFRFGIWSVGEGLGGWFMNYGDNLLVAKLISVEALGIYSVGWNISTMIFNLLISPFISVLYPTLSRLQNNIHFLKSTFYKVVRLIILIALPMATGLLLIGSQIVSVIFGHKWHGLGLVLSLIGFLVGMSWIVSINSEIYRAIGRPDLNTKLIFINIAYYLPAFLISAPFGLNVFTQVRLGVSLLSFLIHICLCVRILGVSPLYLWYEGKPMILSALTMASMVGGFRWMLNLDIIRIPGLFALVLLVVLGILTYSSILWILDRSFILQTKNLIKKVVLT